MYHYVRQIKQRVIFNRSHMLEVLMAVLLQNLWRLITYQNRNRHIIRHIYVSRYTKQVSVESRTYFLVKVSTFENFPFPQFGVFKFRYLQGQPLGIDTK